MTCYDCIHCNACSEAGDSGYSCLKEDVSKCKHFKNKADFVEVVRCKDCKYCFEIYRGAYACSLQPTPNNVPLWHFCSYGEKNDFKE